MHRFHFALLACCSSTGSPPPITGSTGSSAQPAPGPTVLAFRKLAVRGELILDAARITIDGQQATLELNGSSSRMPAYHVTGCTSAGQPVDCPSKIVAWTDEIRATMTGTAARSATGIELRFEREEHDGKQPPPLVMQCAEQLFEIAPPDAVVTEANCAFTWSAATERVRLLGCTGPDRKLSPYSAPPGIEEVYFLAGCGDRPRMYRRIHPDESVSFAAPPP